MRAALVPVCLLTLLTVGAGCPGEPAGDAGADPADAGDDGGVDAGAPIADGDVGGACLENNTCNDAAALCVNGTGGNACRLSCALVDAGADPCGPGSTCRPLTGGGGGVCLPASGLDGACPCDEGFLCVNVSGAARCRPTCTPHDGGPDDCPAETGTCHPTIANADAGPVPDGVCVE